MTEKSSSYSVQGYNFVTLLKRLEAATSRLEDITIFQEQTAKAASTESAAREPAPKTAAAGDVNAGTAIGTVGASASGATLQDAPAAMEKQEDHPLVSGFQHFIDNTVVPFVQTSKEIDSDLGKVAEYLLEAFVEEKTFLKIVSLSKSTSQEKYLPYLGPIQEQIKNVIDFKERYRGKLVNHVNSVNEFVVLVGWVTIECLGGNNKPIISFITELNESSKFWSNRIIKEFKDKDSTQVEWVKQLNAIFTGLRDYINEYHSSGLAWNKEGVTIDEAAKQVKEGNLSTAPAAPAAPAPPTGSGAPPPPPPPLPPASIYEDKGEPKKETGLNAVFSELNKGTDITKSLKKVDKSQMTHKNPELRRTESNSSTGSKKSIPKPPKKPSALSSSKVKKAAPKKELIDSKWLVSNVEDEELVTIEGEMNQSIFIGKCSNVTIKVVGKVNAITVSECTKIGIVTDALISGIDIIKTNKFQLQPLGFVPLINVDQSHDGEIYLNKDTIDAQILTSQSTSCNVYATDPDDDSKDAEFSENAIPEQLVHTYDRKTKKFVSSVVEAAG